MPKSLSVIVPAYNEETLLPGCLDSLLAQTADPASYEVVVVDNHSTDQTAAIARNKGVRVEEEQHKGYVHAIRRGVEASQGDLLAFTDADCRVSRDWVTRILRDFDDTPEIVALGGKLDFFDLNPILKHVTKGMLAFSSVLPGNNMVLRREALDRIGGIDPRVNLSADYWLTLKLRRVGKIRMDRGLIVCTSGRRFQGAFASHLQYAANAVFIRLFGRPLFFDFPDVRGGSGPEE
jgi:cellulose synthase/poly-beta-1,6-N-acetylglucosamine synthase-like glycosyltransferase